jgi:chromosome segregation ATPase
LASNRPLKTARSAPDLSALNEPDELARLEAEVERWKGAARRLADEIGEEARAAKAAHQRANAELSHTLAAVRAQLEASRRQLVATAAARDAAQGELERKTARVRVLTARVLRREAARIAMARTVSWRITAPLRALHRALLPALLRGARLRRRLLGRRVGP